MPVPHNLVTFISVSYSTHHLEIGAFFRHHLRQKRRKWAHCLFIDCPALRSCHFFLESSILYNKRTANVTNSGQATDAVLRVLFVCTGNTCRSPMAETLFRKLVTEKLDCRDWELRERGIDVFSAGIAAGESDPATREAVQVMREMQFGSVAALKPASDGTDARRIHTRTHYDRSPPTCPDRSTP